MLRDLTSWQSIRSGLKHEDDMARRDAEAYHQLIHGNRSGTPKGEADEMGDNIYLGDYAVNQHLPQSGKSPGILGKALTLGLALAAGTTPLAVGAYFLADALKEQPTVEVPGKTETVEKVIDWSVGEPTVE